MTCGWRRLMRSRERCGVFEQGRCSPTPPRCSGTRRRLRRIGCSTIRVRGHLARARAELHGARPGLLLSGQPRLRHVSSFAKAIRTPVTGAGISPGAAYTTGAARRSRAAETARVKGRIVASFTPTVGLQNVAVVANERHGFFWSTIPRFNDWPEGHPFRNRRGTPRRSDRTRSARRLS